MPLPIHPQRYCDLASLVSFRLSSFLHSLTPISPLLKPLVRSHLPHLGACLPRNIAPMLRRIGASAVTDNSLVNDAKVGFLLLHGFKFLDTLVDDRDA